MQGDEKKLIPISLVYRWMCYNRWPRYMSGTRLIQQGCRLCVVAEQRGWWEPYRSLSVHEDFLVWLSLEEVIEMAGKFIRRVGPDEEGRVRVPLFQDQQLQADMPALFDFMTATEYPDGSPRKTSSVTLFVQDGVMKAVLKDADNARAMWVSGESLEEVMMSLECALSDSAAKWRWDGPAGQGTTRRKPKAP